MNRHFFAAFLLVSFLMVPSFLSAQNFGMNSLNNRRGGILQGAGLNGAGSSTEDAKKKPGTGPGGATKSDMGGFSLDYQIHLLGQVKEPGTYRLPPSIRLDEAIAKADGIAERGSFRKVELRRDGNVYRYDLFKFQKFGDLSQNPFLLDNDVVFVPFAETNVAIHGPVKSNSVYELTANEKSVWDLVELAGGYTVGVSEKDPVKVVRFTDGKKEVISIPNVKLELEKFALLNGDTVIIPHMFSEDRRFDYSVLELPADNIYLPDRKNEVFVTGAVTNGGAFPFDPTYAIRDFVNMAGPTELAKLQAVYILTANGKYVRNPVRKKKFRLSPGDTIIIPKRRVTTDNVLKWYNTLTGSVFTGFAFKQLIQ